VDVGGSPEEEDGERHGGRLLEGDRLPDATIQVLGEGEAALLADR
jgi:hypothetical protein